MIWTLKVLDYYQIIGGVDFSLSIFTGAKLMVLEEIPIKQELEKFIVSLKIPDIFEELEASFLQRYDENYVVSDTFPQYEIFEGFADWEIRGGVCRKKLRPGYPSAFKGHCSISELFHILGIFIV